MARIDALCVDANDPRGLARFWSDLLDRPVAGDGTTLVCDGSQAVGWAA